MRKQFIWLDRAGFHYKAPGNISIGAGSKGSVFFWYHPSVWWYGDHVLWEASCDSSNGLKLLYGGDTRLTFRCTSGGVNYNLNYDGFVPGDNNRWLPISCTWDFSTPGQGRLRLYVDGQQVGVPVDVAVAPQGEATVLHLGNKPNGTTTTPGFHMDNFAVWNDVMTLAQHQALKGTGSDFGSRQMARRRLPRQGDGNGTMTLLATFDGTYDATYAAGDAQAYWLVEPSAYHHFARIDDGSSCRGQRCAFRFGLPRHDNSEDDRVPLRSVLVWLLSQGAGQYTTLVDREGWSEINVSALRPMTAQGQGMGWLREAIDPNNLPRPSTVRMRVNLPAGTNPVKQKICLGPVVYVSGGMHGNNFGTWGTGEVFSVVADAGNTAGTFKTNLPARGDNYWQDAELSFHTGVCMGTRLKVSGYNSATGVVTLAGTLPATPAAGDTGMVDFRGRLIARTYPLNETMSQEAWLWEEYDTDKPWFEIEATFMQTGAGVVRLQRGRTTWMDLNEQRCVGEGTSTMFGRNGLDYPTSFSCNILIESLIIEGPGSYQAMSPDSSRVNRGFDLSDRFLLRDMRTGHGTRVWRAQDCSWATGTPTVANQDLVIAELRAAGTWRDQAILLSVIQPQTETDSVVAPVRGTGADGIKRLGYLRGTWNASTNRVMWADETPPPGKSNPFLELGQLQPWESSDSTWGVADPTTAFVLATADGKWSLIYSGPERNPDHYITRALHGAEDRWSFDNQRHWWTENPLVPGFGGVDSISPMFTGINLFGNRDAEWLVAANPYARDSSRRFSGYCRGKTILPLGSICGNSRRPLLGWTSPDLKAFFLLPHGNSLSPLGLGETFNIRQYAVSEWQTAAIQQFYGSMNRLVATDDDRHFQQLTSSYLPAGPPLDTFRLGDRRVYYYLFNSAVAMAYIGWNRETFYQLNTGATSGIVETPILTKPGGGWGELIVNVAPESGHVRVTVLDPATDQAIAGFDAADCDALSEGVERAVSWRTAGLSQVTAGHIRLRFTLSRENSQGISPKVYAWEIREPAAPMAPRVTTLLVEGKRDPAGVKDGTPTLSWSYSDPASLEQSAYQVVVASTQELLDQNQGDLWDTGIVAGDENVVEYGGAPLADETTYFWKVRVQNAEGVWSEEW